MTSPSPAPVRPAFVRPAQPPQPPQPPPARLPRLIWQGRFLPAFWTIASALSLVVNVILVIIVVILLSQLFQIKNLLGDQLIGGLYSNFVKMDEAHIRTNIVVKDTILVKDTIPVVFDLPLKTDTTVVLTKDAYLSRGKVMLNGAWVTTDIILNKGTPLNIYLDMVVPVNQTLPIELKVPVELNVPVDIPLNQTELHEPFVGLRGVVEPYKNLLDSLPGSWKALCPAWLCRKP
ncbi:MAG: hypothetical protein ACKOC5_09315 [Chloroflexota bacterium]